MSIFKTNKDVRDALLSAHGNNMKEQLCDLIYEKRKILQEMVDTGDYDDDAFEIISGRELK